MKGLNSRDVRRLKKAFLEKLNEQADGNEEQCFDRVKIFEATELRAYDKSITLLVYLPKKGWKKRCLIMKKCCMIPF